MKGDDTRFLTGTDEYSVNIAMTAESQGTSPKAFVDEMVELYRTAEEALAISPDRFIRTTDPDHQRAVHEFIRRAYANDDLYLGDYEGWYCDGCESFKTEKELVDGKCPDHKVPPIKRTEPCHYFAWSKFQDWLLKYYEENPDFIQPESRRNEVLSLVQTELKDQNITFA